MFDIAAVREEFPILKASVYGKPLVYLDNAATTQKPRAVIDRLHRFYTEQNSNIHRGIHYLSEAAGAEYESARKRVRKFIHATDPREIVFTRGTTEAVNIVAHCLGGVLVEAGDEVVVSVAEHHSNFVPWQMLCERKGATLRVIPCGQNGSVNPEVLRSTLSDKSRIVALTAVSNVLGSVNASRELIAVAHNAGVPVILDAAQAVQHMSIDVQELDCDFLAFSGHKMYAGTGIGVLFGKEKWLEMMPPYQYGGGMIGTVSSQKTSFAEPPYKFEAGTPNRAGAIGLEAAIGLMESVGMDTIREHERDLLEYAGDRLTDFGELTVYGPEAGRCGVISFNIPQVGPFDAATILDKMGIALRSGMHCAEPLMAHLGIRGTLRASFALYNTKDEVDSLISALSRVRTIAG